LNYILGGAYKSLLFSLYIRNIKGKEITIITYKKDIIEFCKSQDIKYIKFKKIYPNFYSIFKIFKLKKILQKLIKDIDIKKEDKFFLPGNGKANEFFYLAKELSKNGCVGFYKLADGRFKDYKPPRYKPIFLRGAISRFFLKLILDLDLVYYRQEKKCPFLGVDEKFLNKYNILEYLPDIHVEDMLEEVVKKNKLDFKNYENLFIDTGPQIGKIKSSSLKSLYTNLFQLELNFAVKKHPKSKITQSQSDLFFDELYKNIDELPRYIPVELIYNNVKKNVLSLYSTALITATKLPHLKSISLLELVEWCDENYKREWKERLSKGSNNKIVFPSNFDELKRILIS